MRGTCANHPDQAGPDLPKIRGFENVAPPKTLHLTVRPSKFWIERFEQRGFVLHHALKESPDWSWMRRVRNMCCSFVLIRAGASRLPAGIGDAREEYLRSHWPEAASSWNARSKKDHVQS